MKNPSECQKLTELSDACLNGACNMGAIIRSFGRVIDELRSDEVKHHPAVKIILGQLSFLCGESLGPTSEALQAFESWRHRP